ncbi:LsmAD domain-containing protein [Colletotrichum higginsianum]|nr:LsmAD domain-containing protein [Colletotrichum higginsianum]
MLITSKEFLERQSFAASSIATPNHTHVVPSAHQHQLPFHLQQPAHGMGPRQSPHMPPMPIQNQHGHVPHTPYQNMDDHRMMHSNSAQSFASPRMTQVPITYTPAMSSTGQVPYNQPMMQPFVGPGTPQMGGYRNFSNNHQYMPQQPGGPMGAPMMPQFMNPQGMVPAPGQMPMYAGSHTQFMSPNGAPPQPIPGANGYPSPGRPSAPMMVHQGSQQGQPVYGMSPNVQYQQPAFTPQQPGGQALDPNTSEQAPRKCISTERSIVVGATAMEPNPSTTTGSIMVPNKFPQCLPADLVVLLTAQRKPNEVHDEMTRAYR